MNLVLPRTLHPYNFHLITVIVKMLAKCRAYVQKGSKSTSLKDNICQFLENKAFKVMKYIVGTMLQEVKYYPVKFTEKANMRLSFA